MSGGASPRSKSARARGWTLPGSTVRTELLIGCVTSAGGCWAQSGLAMRNRQASRLAKKGVETLDKGGKTDDERDMVTPWRGKDGGGLREHYLRFSLSEQ